MKQSLLSFRFLFPLLFVIGINLVAGFIYDSAAELSPGFLREILIAVFAPLLFISLWFFAFVGPPLAYYLGAGFGQRLIIAFANPLIWIICVESKLACQYNAIEMIYFFFLPWTFGIVCVTLVEFSLSEIVCRFIDRKRRNSEVKILPANVLTLLVLGSTGMYFGLIRGQEWVYLVVHHFKDNFL